MVTLCRLTRSVYHLNVCPASEHWEAGWPAGTSGLRGVVECQLELMLAYWPTQPGTKVSPFCVS